MQRDFSHFNRKKLIATEEFFCASEGQVGRRLTDGIRNCHQLDLAGQANKVSVVA
jgi:hypothetical protein